MKSIRLAFARVSARPLLGLALGLWGCATAPLPQAVTQADLVSESKAAIQAQEYAPQAYAVADKLRAEARFLHGEGRTEESEAAAEQAIAGYTEAFALTRVARAEERIEKARTSHDSAEKKLKELDLLQGRLSAEADAFEMRALVHLDTEEVKDADSISPQRARARRLAARQLTAEAGLLCLSAQLLRHQSDAHAGAQLKVERLKTELTHGSTKNDLYPRATEARALCLSELSKARRPAIKKAPESAEADRLLKSLTETSRVFAYRDDRGVVVNLGNPAETGGQLTKESSAALKLLGGVAKAHPQFPVIVVAHTAKKGQKKRGDALGALAQQALLNAGASRVSLHPVFSAQPLVSTRVRGAAKQNERVEVVFVTPGR